MTTTTSIRVLQEEHNLLLSNRYSFTNEEIINAAAIVAFKNGCTNAESLYEAIWNECDMAMAAALNEMDKNELLEFAKIHS